MDQDEEKKEEENAAKGLVPQVGVDASLAGSVSEEKSGFTGKKGLFLGLADERKPKEPNFTGMVKKPSSPFSQALQH